MAAIYNITPTHARSGDVVIINGTGFENATNVRFGDYPYTGSSAVDALAFEILSPNQIKAYVPAHVQGNGIGIFLGGASVANAGLTGFTYDGVGDAPIISSFTPMEAYSTQVVTIVGFNFIGVQAVKFGFFGSEVSATSFEVIGTTKINAVVAFGSASGNVYIETASGEGIKSGFVFLGDASLNVPAISSYSPSAQVPGNKVEILGTGFIGVTAVKFGGTNAMHFDIISDTKINAYPTIGGSNIITLVKAAGNASVSGFTLLLQQKRLPDLPKIGRDIAAGDLIYIWDGIKDILCQGDISQLPFGSGGDSGGGTGGGGNVYTALGSPFKVRRTDDNYSESVIDKKVTIQDIRLLGKSDYVVSATDAGEFENFVSVTNTGNLEYNEDDGSLIIHNYLLSQGSHITIYADGIVSAAQQAYLLSVKSQMDTFTKVLQPVIMQGGTVWPWRKPANIPLPTGWQECLDFRGKILIGQDGNDVYDSVNNPDGLSQAVGTTLGGKTITLVKDNLPAINFTTATDYKGGGQGIRVLSESQNQIGSNPLYSSPNLGGTSKAFSKLPPVKIIKWIEYVG